MKYLTLCVVLVSGALLNGCVSAGVDEETGEFSLGVSPVASVQRVQEGEDRQDDAITANTEAIEGIGTSVDKLGGAVADLGSRVEGGEAAAAAAADAAKNATAAAEGATAAAEESKERKLEIGLEDALQSEWFWLLFGPMLGYGAYRGGRKGLGVMAERKIKQRLSDPSDPLTEAPAPAKPA